MGNQRMRAAADRPARTRRLRPATAAGDSLVHGVLRAQRAVGNRAVAGMIVQRQAVLQRDWTGDRTAEVRAAMTGADWNRPGGPWFLLNGHSPDALVGILRRLGATGSRELAAHPVDGGRYDKERLDFAMAHVGGGGTVGELSAMDAIRSARAGAITWAEAWVVLGKLSHADRITLYHGMDRAELRDLIGQAHAADERHQAAFEEEINAVIAPPVKDVRLDFVPDDSELPGPGGKPWPMGKITVLVKGVPIASIPARGGPWRSHGDPNNPGHTADPTSAGTFTLAAGKPIVTSAWLYSQLADGTPIRDTDTDVEFQRDGRWRSTRTLGKPITRDDIMQPSAKTLLIRAVRRGDMTLAAAQKRWKDMRDAADFSPLSPTWVLNDFGTEGFEITGSGGDIIHTTPETDDPLEVLKPGDLAFSHGCVHVRGSDRDALIQLGYLRGGVKLTVHPYDPAKLPHWGDPP